MSLPSSIRLSPDVSKAVHSFKAEAALVASFSQQLNEAIRRIHNLPKRRPLTSGRCPGAPRLPPVLVGDVVNGFPAPLVQPSPAEVLSLIGSVAGQPGVLTVRLTRDVELAAISWVASTGIPFPSLANAALRWLHQLPAPQPIDL